VRPYFGDGDEFHMGFHFPIMPRIYMGLKKGTAEDMREILRRTPTIPETCQWCIFLRNHDELTLEMVTEEERQWMWEQYAPESRMRLNLGIRRRLAPLLDNDERKIQLAHSLLFTLPGSPILYYGDEIGMGDNIWLEDRNGVRTPMQWEPKQNAGFSDAEPGSIYAPVINDDLYAPARVNVEAQLTDPSSLLHEIRSMIATRKQHPGFGSGGFEWLDLGNENIAAFERTYNDQIILAVHNLSDRKHSIKYETKNPVEFMTDLLTLEKHFADENYLELELLPYQYLWLK
jgi:maltose alpha-D-glucosyltransferase/alpha-amylase